MAIEFTVGGKAYVGFNLQLLYSVSAGNICAHHGYTAARQAIFRGLF
ncbi:hypothetical protein [Mageeibacillus indolicus]|nr:hypothetical protein [Mageeibacillus indolicus]